VRRRRPDACREVVACDHRPHRAERPDHGAHEDEARVPRPPGGPRRERDDAQRDERKQHDRQVDEQRMGGQAEELIKHEGTLRTDPVHWL